MLLLLMLKMMRDHVPPSHPDMPTSMRISCGLVWTATTGEGPALPPSGVSPCLSHFPKSLSFSLVVSKLAKAGKRSVVKPLTFQVWPGTSTCTSSGGFSGMLILRPRTGL